MGYIQHRPEGKGTITKSARVMSALAGELPTRLCENLSNETDTMRLRTVSRISEGVSSINLIIRPMRPSELIEVTKLIHAIFPSVNAETRINKEAGDKVLVADAGGALVGFVHFSERSVKGAAGGSNSVSRFRFRVLSSSISIKGLGVVPEFRSKGVGSALVCALISKFGKSGKPFYLKVRPDNESALALYEKEGFTIKRESKSGKFLLLVRMPEN